MCFATNSSYIIRTVCFKTKYLFFKIPLGYDIFQTYPIHLRLRQLSPLGKQFGPFHVQIHRFYIPNQDPLTNFKTSWIHYILSYWSLFGFTSRLLKVYFLITYQKVCHESKKLPKKYIVFNLGSDGSICNFKKFRRLFKNLRII